jgi:DNA-binding response OmpR family regulator
MPVILLINEDPTFQTVIASLLKKEAYSVVSILGGKKGMEAVKSVRATLIISDLMLSYKSSLEWIAYIKEQPESRHLPLIIISPITNPETMADCREMGVDEYITLPFEPHEFIKKVKDLLLKLHLIKMEGQKSK